MQAAQPLTPRTLVPFLLNVAPVLRPAIERLEESDDFPKDAPILIITDGACDVFAVRREHAFLMPEGARLPFRTAAPTFKFERPSP